MARIAPVDPATASDEVHEALAALPELNIFRTLAHAETAFRPALRVGGAVLTRLELDPVLRELAILTVAREAEAKYEWIQHVAMAKQVGVTDEQIEALADPDRCSSEGADGRAVASAPFDERQATAIDLAACVVRGPRVSSALWDRVRGRFSDREIVELMIAVGYYLMLARLMTVIEIDLDEPAPDGSVTGALGNRAE